MRIFIWHGYLLSGTGSNEYTQALARTLSRQGHDVTVFSQDPRPGEYDLAGARVVRPPLPGALPVFVLDRYENARPRLLGDLTRAELDAFVAANAAAIRRAGPADLLIANHLLLGGPVGAASGLPFVVKVHGSELEFAMRGRPDLCEWAHESVATARAVIAGSHHIDDVVEQLVRPEPGRVVVIPPGVDTDEMRPRPRAAALRDLLIECRADPPDSGDERLPDDGNADRLATFFERHPGSVAVYVGKLSEEKGVPLLVEAAAEAGLPLIVVGFGPLRARLEADAGPDVLFTGPLQHRHLRHLWPLAKVSVVPSVFPEAFGMVAAEAASCGCPPLVAYQTGLAEIADGLAAHYPEDLRRLASFHPGNERALARGLRAITGLPDVRWQELSRGSRAAVQALWGWDSVAERVVQLGRASPG